MNFAYATIMLCALTIGALLSRKTQGGWRLAWWEKLGLGVGAFCGAMIGAKLPFVLMGRLGLAAGSGAWFSDGKTILCGLVGGYFGVEITKFALEIRVKTGDGFAVPVAAAVAVGRLACFEAGCCFGTPTRLPWGLVFPLSGDALPRHPTQLYESLFHATAAVLLYVLWKQGRFRGQLVKLYILAYLAYRFGTEWIRPEPELWLGLTAYQWAALALAPIFAGLWMLDARKIRRAEVRFA